MYFTPSLSVKKFQFNFTGFIRTATIASLHIDSMKWKKSDRKTDKVTWRLLKVSFHVRREEHEWIEKSYMTQNERQRDKWEPEGQEQEIKVRGRCDDGIDVESVEDKCHGASQALAALEFVDLLSISGWRDTYVHYIVAWRLVMRRSVRYLLLWHDAVNFWRWKCKNRKRQGFIGKVTRSDITKDTALRSASSYLSKCS